MKTVIRILNALIVFLTANTYSLFVIQNNKYIAVIFAACFIFINIIPAIYNRNMPTLRLRVCSDGCELLIIFLISSFLSAAYLIYAAVGGIFRGSDFSWIICLSTVIITEAIVFWNGIIRVYLTSIQLEIKWRVLGIVFGWVPIAHLYFLLKIIHIAIREAYFESEKILINKKREYEKICCTKYPLLLVHGVFLEILNILTIGDVFLKS